MRRLSGIGHLYPKAILPDGSEATVIAWLWARTIPCPNPACGAQMPLLKTFQLSQKSNNEHWIKPVIGRGLSLPQRVSFVVQNHSDGVPDSGTVNRHGAVCVACNTAIRLADVREQARDGKMGEQMTAIVVEGDRRRIFVVTKRCTYSSGNIRRARLATFPSNAQYAYFGKWPRLWYYPLASTFHPTSTACNNHFQRFDCRCSPNGKARGGETTNTPIPFVHISRLFSAERLTAVPVMQLGKMWATKLLTFSHGKQFRWSGISRK